MIDFSSHRVLLVNDDGIHARGLKILEDIVRDNGGDFWVVAPDEEKSGASHSISMHVPVRARQIDDRHFAVKGTPTDCVLLAIYELMDDKPTVVLSGINRGANLAEDLIYSGTAAAAREGTLLGVRSIAFSQVFTPGEEAPWETAIAYTPQIIASLLNAEWEPGTFVNVNFPDATPEDVSGTRVVSQGRRPPGSFQPHARVDARAVPYYWIGLSYMDGGLDAGTDLEAIGDNAVAISPIQLDMTSKGMLERLGGQFA